MGSGIATSVRRTWTVGYEFRQYPSCHVTDSTDSIGTSQSLSATVPMVARSVFGNHVIDQVTIEL